MTHSYICRTCGIEHDTIPKAMACFDAHEAEEAGAVGVFIEEAANDMLASTVYEAPYGSTLEINPAPEPIPDTPEPSVRAVPDPLAAELLGRAARHMHDRSQTYDEVGGERSMGKAVTAFNAITGQNLTEAEGWMLIVPYFGPRRTARRRQSSLQSCRRGIVPARSHALP